MRVLIDTNVVLTYVSGRENPFSEEIDLIMRKCAENKIEGAIAVHTLSTIWYVARKLPDETRRDWIRQICRLLTVAGTSNSAVLKAVDNTEFKDFEDALQDCCAESFKADYIVTVNTKDFSGVSTVTALSPGGFLEMQEKQEEKTWASMDFYEIAESEKTRMADTPEGKPAYVRDH